MSLTEMVSKANSPVEGKEKDLVFLISMLDKEDKIEFVRTFESDFWSLVENKMLTKTAVYKFLSGYAPSDERILRIVEADGEARKWLIERVKEKAKKALQIISEMEAEEE
ncbi:hypothetical protein [Sulfuracidifex tepidarius]|uniref:Uncharacterized protein n=1 Tax=Sulfuracidifex tepidarius TaxID=1294262 RepID=A0A510DVR9_9CREN|nr:hypothetical protein [Sulfuracidifex tepidarius]BBG24120.1 hypothetical protein IC006_1422 [Sulfuracidifex tepidarius]BBG26876.1 hypothetical protein IC007_1398 [Sulfuracidifex tepidarius]